MVIIIFTVVVGVNKPSWHIVHMMQVPISCFCPGCPWVPEPVSGPAEGGCGEDQQKLEERALAWEEPQSARLAEEVDTSRIYTCPVTVNMEFEVQHTITCKRWIKEAM